MRSGFAIRIALPSTPLNGELILADVGQNNIEEINRITIGGNYGWAVKEGTFLFNRTTGTIGRPAGQSTAPAVPAGLDRSDLRHARARCNTTTSDGISITGGFVYRGTAIPELVGKYVFGDLALRPRPAAIRDRWPAVLCRPANRRDQRVPAAAVRERQVAERSDGARLRRRTATASCTPWSPTRRRTAPAASSTSSCRCRSRRTYSRLLCCCSRRSLVFRNRRLAVDQ